MKQYGGQYLFPPRPTAAVTAAQLGFYESRNWIAQTKKNGTCSLIHVTPDKIVMWNRHEQPLKWAMPREIAEWLHASVGTETVLLAELLHHKTTVTKNTLYFFDVLVFDGMCMTGTEYSHRYEILTAMFQPAKTETAHLVIQPGVLMARNWVTGFADVFNSLTTDDDEGVVLKDPRGILRDCAKADSNGYWQVKSRRPRKGYAY